MKVMHNLSALGAFNSLNAVNGALQKTMRALSTGMRINSASDDAAGFAISEKMRSQICGMDKAIHNTQDGISLIQTAEGALDGTNSCLQRMRELAVQASNDTLTSQDRQYIQLEIDQLKANVDRIAETTQFNRKRLLDGSCGVLWSCSSENVKAKINGGIISFDEFGQKVDVSGNYRLTLRTEAGQTQIQKSSVMLIKHENVTMDRIINNEAGMYDVKVNNVPAGNYELTSEPPTESRAIITGTYGMRLGDFEDALSSETTDSKLKRNASVLFEVVNVDSENGNISVNATSRVLCTDGTTKNYRQDNIILSEGKASDLSKVLGVGDEDGAFSLTLNRNAAEEFSAGFKFVYNITTAGNVEGADRVITITNEQNPEWPGSWEETQQIYKTNLFKPKEPVDTSAQVVFLIDNSGSMGTSFQTVKANISSFLSNIRAQGVNDVSIAIVRYTAPSSSNGSSLKSASGWVSDEKQLEALLSAGPSGGLVDQYQAVVETVNKYYGAGTTGAAAKHIVLITDTNQETNPSPYTLTDAQNALSSAGVTLSAVRNNFKDIEDLVTSNGHDMNITSQQWGTDLVNNLAKQIGEEAIEPFLNGTPFYQFQQFDSVFPDENSANRIIQVEKDGEITNIAINPTDTMRTAAAKIEAATGGKTTIKVTEDNDTGEVGALFTTMLDYGTKLKFSGDREVLNILGLRSNFEQKFSLDADKVTKRDIHFRNFYLNSENGRVYDGDIVIRTTEDDIPEYSDMTTFEAAYLGQIPKHDVKLRDINNFWDSQGVFMIDRPQTITITQGNGQTAEVTLYETDTIQDIRKKLNDAIAKDLGQSKYIKGSTDNFVSFVYDGTEQNNGSESVAGTFIVRSAVAGKAGELHFSGSEELMKALGLNTIQESREHNYTLSVHDAHSGKFITSCAKSSGGTFRNIISDNIEIEIDPMPDIFSSWNETAKRYVPESSMSYYTLHLEDNSAAFQTGANMGEDFFIQLGDASVNSLGIAGVSVTTRESSARSIGILDNAIKKVSAQRAKLGAYTNALEHTLENLTTSSANLTQAESRIRDADMSAAMIDFVKLQILNQSATSMLAQANNLPQSVLSLMQ